MNKALPYILAIMIAGCGNSGRNQDRPESALATATFDKNDTGLVLSISKGQATVYRQAISDAPVSEARVEDRALDFDGDGRAEVVVYLWEGQNSGDRVLVFGEEAGKWSQWMDVYRPNFESEYVKVGHRESLRVKDPDTGKMKTATYTP